MKKVLAILLCAVILMGSLLSCGKTTPEPADDSTAPEAVTTTSEGTTAEDTTSIMKTIEIKTFPGKTMKIWYSTGTTWAPTPLKVDGDQLSGDIVEQAGFSRNCYMEETFKIKLDYNDVNSNPNSGADFSTLNNLNNSGDISEYDLVFTGATPAGQLAIAGFYYDLNESENIDQMADYYENRVNKQVELFGHSYFASGYYSTMNTAAIDVTYVNVDIVEAVSAYKLNDLYNIALDNKWTIEKLLEIGANYATPEANAGDPLTDHYSLVLSANYCQNIYYDLGGTDLKYNDSANKYEIVISDQRNVNVLEWLQNNVNAGKGAGIVKNDKHTSSFLAHSAPFMIVTYKNIKSVMESDIDWAFLPTPLYEEGDEYKAYSDAWNLNFAGIPAQCAELEKADYLFEMFMRSSYETVYPAYYELCFGTKYQRDAVGSQIFDIMASSRVISFANIYGMNLGIASMISSGAPVASTLKGMETTLKNGLKTITPKK